MGLSFALNCCDFSKALAMDVVKFSSSEKNLGQILEITDESDLELMAIAYNNYFGNPETNVFDAYKKVTENFGNPEYKFYKYVVDSSQVSYAILKISEDWITIDHFFTDKKFQFKGYGSKFLKDILQISNNKGLPVKVTSSNQGLNLYRKYMKEISDGVFEYYPPNFVEDLK